jgi:hypothetical protein
MAPGRVAVREWIKAALQRKPGRNHGDMVALESHALIELDCDKQRIKSKRLRRE